MSRSALFANSFNDMIQKARKEADAQKASVQKELERARKQLLEAKEKVDGLEKQLADIDEELAVGLVAAARQAGIKIDLKRAAAEVTSEAPAAAASTRKAPSDTAREKAAVLALLRKQSGRWLASTEIKETTGVERPVSLLLKNEDGIESQGKGRGVQYRVI